MNRILFSAAFAMVSVSCILAEETYNYAKPGTDGWEMLYRPPFPGPTEMPTSDQGRKRIFDLLRPHAEKEAKTPVQFKGSLRAFRNWAIFTGETQDKSGTPIAFEGNGNSDTVGLFLNTIEGWKLVDYSFGHSDMFYMIWTEQYGIPKSLLGLPE